MPTLIKSLLRATFFAICVCGCVAAGGCQALAAVLDKSGDPTEPAKYSPKKDNMVILVEDYQNPAMVEMVAEHMNRLVAGELIAHKVVPIINPDRLTALRDENREAYRKMQIAEVGKAVGAAQVLYVNITDFTVESIPGTDARRGHAEARVQVRDVATGLPRWPDDAPKAGFQVVVDIPLADERENNNDLTVRNALSRGLAARVARLFYAATTNEQDPAPAYPESDLR